MAKLLSLEFSTRVEAAPERVWSVLGDFGNEHLWTPTIRHSRRDRPRVEVGTIRRCELEKPFLGRGHIEEELIHLQPGESLAYRLRGGMGPFASVEGEWRIRPDAGGTFVTAQARMQPRNAVLGLLVAPLARTYLRFSLRNVMGEFATYIESQEVEA